MRKFFGVFALALFLTGCAQTVQYKPLPDLNNTIDDPKKGRIYVVRPTRFGSAVAMKIKDNGEEIGKTYGHSYLSWERDPGMTTIVGEAENKSSLPLSVKEGESYYIKQSVEMGIIVARNELSPMDEALAKEKMKKMKAPKFKAR